MEGTIYTIIAKKISQGEIDRQKAAVFHTQVLLHADQLTHVDAKDFCRRVGMPESYSVEFYKMMNVSKMLRQLGYHIGKG